MIQYVTLNSWQISDYQVTMNVSGKSDNSMDERPFIEQYGLQTRPPVGSRGIALLLDGKSEKAAIIGVNDKSYSKDLSEGEVRLYDKFGNEFYLKDGEVNINTNGNLKINVTGNIEVTASNAKINASNISLNGNVGSSGGSFDIGGGGGSPIARIGDKVVVDGREGVIISGSNISRSV